MISVVEDDEFQSALYIWLPTPPCFLSGLGIGLTTCATLTQLIFLYVDILHLFLLQQYQKFSNSQTNEQTNKSRIKGWTGHKNSPGNPESCKFN